MWSGDGGIEQELNVETGFGIAIELLLTRARYEAGNPNADGRPVTKDSPELKVAVGAAVRMDVRF